MPKAIKKSYGTGGSYSKGKSGAERMAKYDGTQASKEVRAQLSAASRLNPKGLTKAKAKSGGGSTSRKMW